LVTTSSRFYTATEFLFRRSRSKKKGHRIVMQCPFFASGDPNNSIYRKPTHL
jgi:hypothetical protein